MKFKHAARPPRAFFPIVLGLGMTLIWLVGLQAARGASAVAGGQAPAVARRAHEGGVLANLVTITVTTIDDDLTNNGNCTLREAVQAANTDAQVDVCPAGSGADVILLPATDYQLSLVGAGEDNNAAGDLDISSSLTVRGVKGSGQTSAIRSDGLDRLLHITAGGITVTLENIAVVGGDVNGSGGGIFNQSDATLYLFNSGISNSIASVSGGGLYNQAGEISLDHSSFVNNACVGDWSCNGGGVDNRGVLNILDSTIVNNTADGTGGGIFLTADAVLNVLDSTLYNNASNRTDALGGGAVYVELGAVANIANTFFVANFANNDGAGILSRGILNLTHVTLVYNDADDDLNGAGNGGGISATGTSTVTLKNTIVAINTDGNGMPDKPDVSGTFLSGGYNLIGDQGEETWGTGPGDLVGTSGSPIDPLMGLFFIGFPGYLELMSNSPAIDHVPPGSCAFVSLGSNPLFSDGAAVGVDHRGVFRPFNGYCDIGTFEFGTPLWLYLPTLLK